MKYLYTHFLNHILFYLLVALIIIVGVISYDRFMLKHDYIVEYEGTCDPVTEKCFVGCEDDACTEEYYYLRMQKYAPDLYMECGSDITDCEDANSCLPSDQKCSMTYCAEGTLGDICKGPTGENLLQNNNIKNNNI